MLNDVGAVNEESGHIVGEEHHPRCALSDEEAGEIAAAKETEKISKEDVEIRRLVEERRNTPKEEKQRLKEVNTCIKNVSETKEWKDSETSKEYLKNSKV